MNRVTFAHDRLCPLRGHHGVVLPGLSVRHSPMRPAFVRAARLSSLSRLRVGHPCLRAWPMPIGRWLSPLPTFCRHLWLRMRVRRVKCTPQRSRPGAAFPALYGNLIGVYRACVTSLSNRRWSLTWPFVMALFTRVWWYWRFRTRVFGPRIVCRPRLAPSSDIVCERCGCIASC